MVRYDENDIENDYGFTRKMTKIWNLVESGRTLENADFVPTEEDIAYYKHAKRMSDIANIDNHGSFVRMVRYLDDID